MSIIKKARIAKNLTQEELAKKLYETTPEMIDRWEEGEEVPILSAYHLSQVLDCDLLGILFDAQAESND